MEAHTWFKDGSENSLFALNFVCHSNFIEWLGQLKISAELLMFPFGLGINYSCNLQELAIRLK